MALLEPARHAAHPPAPFFAAPKVPPLCDTLGQGVTKRAPLSFLHSLYTLTLYYKPPTLRHSPTSRIRGLNLKGPGGRPRGRGKWRPQENKTQPTATASTGGKKVICGRNAQKCQKYSVGKCPSGARRNRSTGGLNRNYIALNVWWRAAASNLEERPKTAENGRVWRVFDAAGRRPAERKFITFYYW